jgi:hypothetical protein
VIALVLALADPCELQLAGKVSGYDCRNYIPEGSVCVAADPKQTKGVRKFVCKPPERPKKEKHHAH